MTIDALSVQGGGGLTYLQGLLPHLAGVDRGDAYEVITGPGWMKRIGVQASNVRGIEMRFPGLAARIAWEQLGLAGWMRRAGAEVLLAAGNAGPVIRACPFVVVVQNVEPLAPLPSNVPPSYRRRVAVMRALMLASLRRARAVIAISEYVRRLVADAVPDHAPVRVIYPGAPQDAQVTVPGGASVREKLQIRRPYLLAVSGIKHNKNLPMLIRAFADAGIGHDLVIVGDPDHPWEARAVEAARAGLDDRVRVLSGVERQALRALYDGATALVFPSRLESFGFPVLEAMAYGVPVAAADIEPVREIGRDAMLPFSPDDTSSMAAALRRIIADESLRRRLRLAGRERSRSFTWATSAEQTYAVLALARNRAKVPRRLGAEE